MKKRIFTGCATALITPFTPDGNDVDYKAFEKLLSFQLENDIDALVVAGTTGESPVLTKEEKLQLIKKACEFSCGKIPVIAGTGSNNTSEAVKKSNDSEKQGVDGLLIVTPYYNKCTQEGLIDHYFYIADRVSTPIIVYNVPSRTGVNISSETYKALSEHKNIVAVKEAGGNISEFAKTSVLCRDNLDFYSGNDDQTLPMMALGAKGVISVVSNIIPHEMKLLTQACIDSNFDEGRNVHEKYLKLMNTMFCEVNPIPVKSACNILYGFSKSLRLPLTSISSENEKIIEQLLRNYNMIK
ncbi:MAG: 4-hydroxy-tetrahydrodipicolinate synthase [Clostridia bacterium]|nr:4-hydroxy-tetrahydrodipicolinate synthase [Clostridia bacterium]